MSEYVVVESRASDDPDLLDIVTNQRLAPEGDEIYRSFEEGDAGSPIAQMLFSGVHGLRALAIRDQTMTLTRDPNVPWEEIVDEVRDALRDFFL